MATNAWIELPVEGGGGGVTSLNSETGAINIVAGSGITVTPAGQNITIASTGSGTVTSVGLADSTNLFNITGSPVTTSGTLTLSSYKSQTQNTFLAAPNGSSGAPTFRTIVAADVPTLNQNTTGTASNVTGVVAIANGGTGQTTAGAGFNALSPMTTGGDIIYGGTSGAATRLANGSSGQVLTSNGGTAAPSWQTGGLPGAWSNWTPTYSASVSGTLGSVTTGFARYVQFGKTVFFTIDLNITNNGTAVGGLEFTLPITPQTDANCVGRENAVTGSELQGIISTGGFVVLYTYNNNYTCVAGYELQCSGFYESV